MGFYDHYIIVVESGLREKVNKTGHSTVNTKYAKNHSRVLGVGVSRNEIGEIREAEIGSRKRICM